MAKALIKVGILKNTTQWNSITAGISKQIESIIVHKCLNSKLDALIRKVIYPD